MTSIIISIWFENYYLPEGIDSLRSSSCTHQKKIYYTAREFFSGRKFTLHLFACLKYKIWCKRRNFKRLKTCTNSQSRIVACDGSFLKIERQKWTIFLFIFSSWWSEGDLKKNNLYCCYCHKRRGCIRRRYCVVCSSFQFVLCIQKREREWHANGKMCMMKCNLFRLLLIEWICWNLRERQFCLNFMVMTLRFLRKVLV